MPEPDSQPKKDDTEELFFQARAIEAPSERTAFLQDACAGDADLRERVQSLLAAEARAGNFLSPAEEPSTLVVRTSNDGASPANTRTYKLLELMGEGGHGRVYRARQAGLDLPPVALKIVRSVVNAEQIVARFETERRVLAILDHPGITRILDVGTTVAGQPFFAMELVDGLPITAYADERRLTVRERLVLFRKVCDAVQHAHLRGVIHRDLKPSNILVTEIDGEALPKVIDFGIAKATRPLDGDDPAVTAEGCFLGTPQYMSPEQTGLSTEDVDMRADVYSLGVVLFELLTGTTPLNPAQLRRAADLGEMKHLIEKAHTPRPSTRVAGLEAHELVAAARGSDRATLGRTLRRELDWIVLKALEHERERRYETLQEFSHDVQRFLDDETVLARPQSLAYKARKFAARNRTLVIASGAVASALVVAAVATTAGIISSLEAELEVASANAQKERIARYQADRIGDVDPAFMGALIREMILRGPRDGNAQRDLVALLADTDFTSVAHMIVESTILTPALDAIGDVFRDEPLVQARILHTVGASRTTLGLLDAALEPLERALALRREFLGETHEATLDTMAALATALRHCGQFAEATRLTEVVLAGRLEAHGEADPRTISALVSSAAVAGARSETAEAERLSARAIEASERSDDPDAGARFAAINNLGVSFEQAGDNVSAEREYRRGWEEMVAAGIADSRQGHSLAANLARVLALLGRNDEALKLMDAAIDGLTRLLSRDHPETIRAHNSMSIVLFQQRDFGRALEHARTAFEGTRELLGPEHENTLIFMANVAKLSRGVGDVAEAEDIGIRALELAQDTLAEDSWILGAILLQHGRTLTALERFEEAEVMMVDGYWILHDSLGESHERVPYAREGLRDLYSAWDQVEPGFGHAQAVDEWR